MATRDSTFSSFDVENVRTAMTVGPHAIVVLLLAAAVSGCDGHSTLSPTPPTPPVASPPPGSRAVQTESTLSGVVTEMTPDGPLPLAGVRLYCDACGWFGHAEMTTDATGLYHFGDGGIWLDATGLTPILVFKEGYEVRDGSSGPLLWSTRLVKIDGDTRIDFHLVRRE